jgi:hypothetical protein
MKSVGRDPAPDRDKCENGNEPSGAIRCGEFLDKLRNWQLPKRMCSTDFNAALN